MSYTKDSLSVLLITHNRFEYTKRTISSLISSIQIPFLKLVIVDNASNEPGMNELMDSMELEGAIVIRLDRNLGWGAAVNIGMKECMDTEYVLLSNNDVEYKENWYEQSVSLLERYPKIGILGLWKHTAHSTIEDKGDILIRDNMPAVAWFMRNETIADLGDFPENGPCSTKGGNGEDTSYCLNSVARGYWLVGPKEDLAVHIDGY